MSAQDLVVAINDASDQVFALKKDLETTKIRLSQLAPSVDFKPYAVNNNLIDEAQTVGNEVYTRVLQSLPTRVLKSAQTPSLSPEDKADEAAGYIRFVRKGNYALDTNKNTSEFSSAIQSASAELNDIAESLGNSAGDEAKLNQLSEELAALKKQKADAIASKKGFPGKEILDKDVIGNMIGAGFDAHDKTPKATKAEPKKSGGIGDILRGFGTKPSADGETPKPDDTSKPRDNTEELDKKIADTQGQINVTQARIQKAKSSVVEVVKFRDSLPQYVERFEVAAGKLDQLKDFTTAAEAFVNEYIEFLGTEEAKNAAQLHSQTELLKQRCGMLQNAGNAISTFLSRKV